MNSTLYFADVKDYVADRTDEIKSFGDKNSKKIQDNIISLKCDIAYLHNCTKGTIKEQMRNIMLILIFSNILINLIFYFFN